jgi:hypothetical protein
MKRTYRSKRKLRRFTRKRGGANANCENETKKAKYKISSCEALGFTTTMREAGLGTEYQKTSIAGIHNDGEQRTVEQLRELTFLGMVDWWSRKLKSKKSGDYRPFDYDSDTIRKINYDKKDKGDTPEEFKQYIDALKAYPINPDMEQLESSLKIFDTLDILGAFYHRYKIVIERFTAAMENVSGGVKGFFKDQLESGKYGYKGDMTPYEGTGSFETCSTDENFPEEIRTKFKVIAEMLKNDIASKDFPIQIALDRTQCIMFLIVKKVKLPKCFMMDPRIERLAKTIVRIGWGRSSLEESLGAIKLDMTVGWLEFIQNKYDQLNDPPVTFNLFE